MSVTAARDEQGSTIILASICMVVMLLMAAFAVDLGAAYSVRRQNQSAADAGVISGTMDLHEGVDAYAERAAAAVRGNLDETYTDAEWRDLWAHCTDPDARPLHGTVLGEATECISADVLGTTRVRVPDQQVQTAFAGVVGIDEVAVAAEAEAELTIPGVGGVLPFAVLSSAGSGAQLCLRSSTSGQASPPCTGSDSGNFGALESPQYGNPNMGTEDLPCNLNKTDQLAINISVGIDHYIRQHVGQDILDSCSRPFGPTMINTFQGISGGLWEGMIAGAEVNGQFFPGRLTLGAGAQLQLNQGTRPHQIDNTPLWEMIPLGKGDEVPTSCHRETFDALALSARTAQLQTCMTAYVASGSTAPIFDLDGDDDDRPDIFDTARFGIVPQFQESSFPDGNGYLRIAGFRAVYLQGLYFGCTGGGTCDEEVQPGEGTNPVNIPNGSAPLDQVTGFLVPFGAVDQDLLEGAVDGMGAYQVALSR